MDALENGDFIYSHNSAPFCGYASGVSRIPQALSDAGQVSSTSCALSEDATLAAFGHASGTLLDVYTVSTWARISAASFSTGAINALAFSPNGAYLAIGHNVSPYVTILRTSDWTKVADPATLPAAAATGVAWSPDGAKLAVSHSVSPFLTVYNTADWSKMANPASIPNVNSLCVAYSPDGTKIAVGLNASPYIRIVNASDLTPAASAPTISPVSQINAIAYSPDGSKMALAAGSSAYLRVFNTADWSAVTAPTIAASALAVAWASNTELMVGSTGYPRLTLWNLTTGATETRSSIAGNVSGISAKKYTPKTISGAVKDSSDNGILRTVRAYRRDTGELIGSANSNPATGNYSISCRYSVECDVVMLDDAAGTLENDQILRTTPV